MGALNKLLKHKTREP